MPRPPKTSKKRKFHGTGTIDVTESKTRGTRFEAQAYLGLRPDGKQNRRSKTFSSKQAAVNWLKDVMAPSLKASHIDHRRRRLGEVAEAYMVTAGVRANLKQLRPNTFTDYKRVHRKITKLPIAMVQLEKLTEGDVLGALQAIKNGKVGKASEQDANRVLKQLRRVLAFAVAKKWTTVNVALAVDPIKIDRLERSIWTPGKVQRFLAEARRHPQHYVLFYFALSYGCRIGELMALRWQDIDLDNQTFRIDWSYDSKHKLGPPKYGSRRTIHITSGAVRVLQEHLKEQEREKEFRGDAWQERGLVFPSSVGTHLNPSNIRRVFDRLIEMTGVPKITLHDLRHTAASAMIRRGDPISLVSQVLGHKDASMTARVYIHVIEEQQKARANDIETLYGDDRVSDQLKGGVIGKTDKGS